MIARTLIYVILVRYLSHSIKLKEFVGYTKIDNNPTLSAMLGSFSLVVKVH